jgi:hypothetical protein
MAAQDIQQKAKEKAAYTNARLVYDQAWTAYVNARGVDAHGGDCRERARMVLNEAWVRLDKAWRVLNTMT